MQSLLLLFCIASFALGAQVTIINRCPYEIQMQGVNIGNGQSRTTELGTVGDIKNAGNGAVLANVSHDTNQYKNSFPGDLIVGNGVTLNIPGPQTWNDAVVVLNNGVTASMTNTGAVISPKTCSKEPNCIVDYVYPTDDTLTISICQ